MTSMAPPMIMTGTVVTTVLKCLLSAKELDSLFCYSMYVWELSFDTSAPVLLQYVRVGTLFWSICAGFVTVCTCGNSLLIHLRRFCYSMYVWELSFDPSAPVKCQ